MLIDGVHIIFIAPPVFLLLLAITVGTWRLSTRGAKAALVSVVRILVYGVFTLFILFFVWIGIYYSTGGH
jgi:hypothetical protein